MFKCLIPCKWKTWYKCLVCQRFFQTPDGLIGHRKETKCGQLYPTPAQRLTAVRELIKIAKASIEIEKGKRSRTLSEQSEKDDENIEKEDQTSQLSSKPLRSEDEEECSDPRLPGLIKICQNNIDDSSIQIAIDKRRNNEEATDYKEDQEPAQLLLKSVDEGQHLTSGTNNPIVICLISKEVISNKCKVRNPIQIHKIDRNKSVVCYFCKKTFSFQSTLELHLRRHTNEKLFNRLISKSKKINIVFADKINLKLNMSLPTESNPLVSEICQEKLPLPVNLKRAIFLHDSDKSHSCKICLKPFGQLKGLKRHLLIHCDINKSHSCYICQKRFRKSNDLKRHILIHYGIKPHSCKICQQRCRDLSGLKEHMSVHDNIKPHSCQICRKDFRRIHDLKRHMFIHEGTKPHSCQICRQDFSRIHDLKRHIMFIHEGIKPHSC